MVRRVPLFLLLLSLATPAVAADLTPNSGPMQFSAQLLDGGIQIGQFSADAVLAEGNFTGIMSATVGGVTLQGELISSRSYLENGTCLLYAESGRNRLLLRGPCDDSQFGGQQGSFEGFFEGVGSVRGGMVGTIAAEGAPASVQLVEAIGVPAGTLTCFWYEHHRATSNHEINEYLTAISMMIVLRLHEDGRYETGASAGTYRLIGDKVLLDGGMFSGAMGTLRPDRSGAAAVVFLREENRDRTGAGLIDPDTTHCTQQD